MLAAPVVAVVVARKGDAGPETIGPVVRNAGHDADAEKTGPLVLGGDVMVAVSQGDIDSSPLLACWRLCDKEDKGDDEENEPDDNEDSEGITIRVH